ncbi:MAG: leucyl aminopeptidase family protein [Candidatus Diapherotrites archaeon]|nr:leucyl aminopeptidase family protein [Candidatus Diapherotrites archaeon]
MELWLTEHAKGKEFGVLLAEKKALRQVLGLDPQIQKIAGREKFEARETQSIFLLNGALGFERFMVVGVSEKNATAEKIRRATGMAVRTAQFFKAKKISFISPKTPSVRELEAGRAIAEAGVLANYSFQKYKTKKEEQKSLLETIELEGKFSTGDEKELRDAFLVCKNANMCRDLINDNSQTVTPALIESKARETAKKTGLKIKVFGEKDLRKMKMGLFLAVSQANTTPPRMVVLEWNGDRQSKNKTVLVGKGICFDTGGLDLKPGSSMETMRQDMAGAATVLGVLKTCAELKIKKNIVGILGLTENLIGEKSYRQGDVLTSMKGLTVENNSTDAEGRLVLADCLYYGATAFDPTLIVSIATLTGNVRQCLGSAVAGFCSTEERTAEKIMHAADKTGELAWRMPLNEDYLAETKSQRADLRSTNKCKTNGMIYGAAFLSNFVEEKPYLHIDIAGTAFLEELPRAYLETGATGYGVRLLVEMLGK